MLASPPRKIRQIYFSVGQSRKIAQASSIERRQNLRFAACCFLIIFSKVSTAIDTLSPSELLTDGMTLVSRNGRRNPINNSTGMLKIESSGKILIQVQNTTVVWSTNSTARVQNPILQLLDSGNLVVKDGKDSNPENYIRQSFDYPSDTMLPEMKIGIDLRTGFHRRLTAWKNWDDPSPSDLTYGIELKGNPELVLRKGLEKYFRSGLWNGNGFSEAPNYRSNPIFDYDFIWNESEVYYVFSLKDKSVMYRLVLNQTQSQRQRYIWSPETQTWKLFAVQPDGNCDKYGLCGPNGNCADELPACQCLTGFRPKWFERWNSSDWSDGCIHSKPLNCQSGDGFIRIGRMKTPDSANSWVNKTINLKECRAKCLRNCSCMAFTNLFVTKGGSGCVMWFDDLLDIKYQSDGQDLYIRVSASEAERKKMAKVKLAIILATVIVVLLGFLLLVYHLRRSRRKLKEVEDNNLYDGEDEDENEDMDVAVFEFGTIAQATDSFSFMNKLGQGGFGPVYKGTLANGQDIAVKRLSKSSGQGPNEFKNEVKLIAKLQHRNLVRLLGCCIHGDERMLVYEYMPNGSLDKFIFDETRCTVLTWSKRFRIICGVARGLLYLHQDSRLRIIHRDLKASNVLLDSEMNPKISDFGMARTFGGDQIEANTNRVVGTYGYMAPEYAIDGLFSAKSDAWRLWKKGKLLDLADGFLVETGDLSKLLRCMYISLLCIQLYPEERPSTASVVLMLGSDNELPLPKELGFLFHKKPFEANSSPGNDGSSSRNEISSSLLEAR
ncbi:hypothetical protein GOBAR_AA00372 [Gossypium barbadense]|uniref:Receptor-like serine/threonine-protein kinase n=1 Tax=Gossypium barbadense TaxID=3634 RepID=A0A2P5YX45_GOSBA|nr:hypothetical protein GOBAR_AA00372 [Gossypium barbadense]